MAQSTAWKQLEKKVATYFQDIYGDPDNNDREIIQRNLRGNDFSQVDSDVDVLNATGIAPFHLVIDCKYRTTQNTWLVDTFKERYDQFKKGAGKEKLNIVHSVGNQYSTPIFQMVIWLPEGSNHTPYYCIRLEDFPHWWTLLKVSKTPHFPFGAIHSEMAVARKNQKFLRETSEKIVKDYFPLKKPLCHSYDGRAPRMVPVVAQRMPKSSLIVLLIPVKAIEKHHING